MGECKYIRILQVNAGNKNFGGVSSYLYNVYNHIDKSLVQFDFLTRGKTTYHNVKNDIEQKGGKVIEFKITEGGVISSLKFSYRLGKYTVENQYKIVQINSGSYFFNLLSVFFLKMRGIPNIIVHSHNIMPHNVPLLKKIMINLTKPLMSFCATDFFACSLPAGEFMFPKSSIKKLNVIYSGMDVNQFSFSSDDRAVIRKELNIGDEYVIGHVGRFVQQKNQKYILNVFKTVLQKNENAILVFVGEGEMLEEIRKEADSLNISEKIIFLGLRNDVSKIYSAFDCFVFPSLYEGLGMALVEAQISGLPCIASTKVPLDTKITDNVEYKEIEQSNIEDWATTISHFRAIKSVRKSYVQEAVKKGFDIKDISKTMQDFYTKKASEGKTK